jgi:hypothetical protein
MAPVARGTGRFLPVQISTDRSAQRPRTCAGGLENCSHRGHGHRFEMAPIPQVLNAPDDSVNGEPPPRFIERVGPKLVIGFLTGGHGQLVDQPVQVLSGVAYEWAYRVTS